MKINVVLFISLYFLFLSFMELLAIDHSKSNGKIHQDSKVLEDSDEKNHDGKKNSDDSPDHNSSADGIGSDHNSDDSNLTPSPSYNRRRY